MIIHKRGDTLDLLAAIPDIYQDGHFVGWTVTAQVRTDKYDYLLADITCTWADPALTRILHLTTNDTTGWDIGPAEMDIQFTRDSDGYTVSSSTIYFAIVEDVTRPSTEVPLVIGAYIKGEKGDRGLTGLQGVKGDTGDTGPQGVAGPIGPQGEIGLTGPQGIQGEVGPTGSQGPIGLTGEQGIQGIQGPPGDFTLLIDDAASLTDKTFSSYKMTSLLADKTPIKASTTGMGDLSANNLVQLYVGDSTTEQAGGAGYLFDTVTTYWRAPGMPAEGMLATINFGGSGYTLKGFLTDPLNASFVGPTGAMPGVSAGPGAWDYYGHKPSGAVSLATALQYRSTMPAYVEHVQWVLCYGINDLILYNDVGTGTVQSIADYISGLLVSVISTIQRSYPGDSVVLRMPNPMTARPTNVAFPSSTAYPTFNTDVTYAQGLVANWNAGLRLAYKQVQNLFPRTILFDTWAKVFGPSTPTIDQGNTATTNPALQDLVHPAGTSYRHLGHELFNLLFGNAQTRSVYNGRRNLADLKITNGWAGNAYDYYGQYFRNNPRYKELGSYNLVGAGSTYMDIATDAASLKKILGGFGAGRVFATVSTDDSNATSFLVGNFLSLSVSVSGTNARITGLTPPTAIYGSRSTITFYTDNYLSPTKISFAGPLVQGQSVYNAIMDVVPTGLASITITTTLAVPTAVVVNIYRHISNTRTLIATGTISGNGFNKTLVSGTDFTAISSVGVLQEVWEVVPTTATSVPAGCAIKVTLNPN